MAVSLSGSAVDDPDQIFYESYVCKSPRNYTGYCNPEVEALIDQPIGRDRSGKAQARSSGKSSAG